MKRVRKWSGVPVGSTIIVKGTNDRWYTYRIEARSEEGDMLMVSFKRPGRVRREETFLFGVQHLMDEGRILK